MNEQIKELAEQAGWDMGDEVCGFTTRLEKFAELVRADERQAIFKISDASLLAYMDALIKRRGEK